MKRVISVFLLLAMLFVAFSSTSLSFAAGNPYDPNAVDTNGNWANCTYWAWKSAYDAGYHLPEHSWGNAGSWYESAQRDGYRCDRSPSANSIAVYKNSGYGHVQYVVSVSGNQMYVIEGGVRGTANGRSEHWNSTDGVYGYIHLTGNYSQKPSNVSLALEKNSFYASEHVTYYCSGNDVSNYVLSIYNDKGNILETVRINPGEYCIRYYEPGSYTAYCEAFNNCGSTFSNNVKFVVKQNVKPSNVKLSLEKTSFYTDEHVTYYCSGNDVSNYVLSIYNDKGNILETVRINPSEYCIRYYEPGSYTAYCEAFNNCGSTFSNNVTFTVKKKCTTHSWNSGTVTKAATCTATGIKTYTCTVCNEIKTETIAKKAHTHAAAVKENVKAATCTAAGSYQEVVYCSVCKAEISRTNKTDAAIGHDYQVNVIKAGAETLGYIEQKCSRCGDVKSQSYFTAPTGKVSGFQCKKREPSAQTVIWDAVETATGYQVQISTKDGKKWSTSATLKAGTTACTFKTLAAGNAYKFRVRFYITAPDGENYFSPWSSTLTSPTLPKGTTLTKLTPAKKAFTAQWKKNAAVNGYQVQYSLKSNFSGAKTITVKSPKTLKAVAKKLNAGKYYYVRIRTYKTIAKVNYFSTWSKTNKVKTK